MQVSSVCWVGFCIPKPTQRMGFSDAVRSSRIFCLVTSLNLTVNFFPMYRRVCRGSDAELHLLPANAQYLNADVVVDADGFAYAAAEDQHGLDP